ncbi:GPP34 family phosphoprotein [bacterium]|nr:GPP34 family phosphoprotein [bacterium]
MDDVPDSGTGLALHQDFVLLALNPETGQFRGNFQSYACAGAVVMELAMHGRIAAEGKKVMVAGTAAFGDPIVDRMLEQMNSAKRPKSLRNWVSTLGRRSKLTHEIAQTLETRGIVRSERKRFLGIIPYTTYPLVDPGIRERLVTDLRHAALEADIPPVRLSTLAAFGESTGILRHFFNRQERSLVKKRLKKWKKDDVYARAVGETIAGVQAAVASAVAVSAAAASTSGGS